MNVFFWQDDFVFLSQVRFATWTDLAKAFLPWTTGQLNFYRPVATQLYFLAGDRLFGFRPELYHVANLLLHAANAGLVYFLGRRLFSSRPVALFVALLYATNRVHFESLCWISGIQEIGATFFCLMAILLYSSAGTHSSFLRILSGVAYLLALMSKENAVVVPLLALSFDVLDHPPGIGLKSPRAKEALLPQAMLWGITAIYLAFRLPYAFSMVTGGDGSYRLDLSATLFTKYGWGVLWSLDVLLYPPRWLKTALGIDSHLFQAFLLGGGLFLAACVSLFMYRVVKEGDRKAAIGKTKIAVWGLLWFTLSVVPFAFVSNFAAYLFMLPIVGLLLVIGWVLEQGWKMAQKRWACYAPGKVLLAGLYIYVLVSGFFMVRSLMKTEGLIKGAEGARATVQAVQDACPDLEAGTVVTLVGFPPQVWWDTRAQAAFRVLYNQPNIQERHFREQAPESLVGSPVLQWDGYSIVSVISSCANPSPPNPCENQTRSIDNPEAER